MLIATLALITAASTATRLAKLKLSVPGCISTSTPRKPTSTAVQRRRRTISPSTNTAPMVTKIGVE